MSPVSNKAVIREFTRIFKNEHNVDGIDHLFAADFRHNFRAPMRAGWIQGRPANDEYGISGQRR